MLINVIYIRRRNTSSAITIIEAPGGVQFRDTHTGMRAFGELLQIMQVSVDV